jgi:NAD(P)-dependent dehydrogenase (short-subunit alcohol dehydrogenase family)
MDRLYQRRPVEEVQLAEWNRVMDVNATGIFLGTKTALPALRQAGRGSIINISSQLGLVGVDNSSPQYQISDGEAGDDGNQSHSALENLARAVEFW